MRQQSEKTQIEKVTRRNPASVFLVFCNRACGVRAYCKHRQKLVSTGILQCTIYSTLYPLHCTHTNQSINQSGRGIVLALFHKCFKEPTVRLSGAVRYVSKRWIVCLNHENEGLEAYIRKSEQIGNRTLILGGRVM